VVVTFDVVDAEVVDSEVLEAVVVSSSSSSNQTPLDLSEVVGVSPNNLAADDNSGANVVVDTVVGTDDLRQAYVNVICSNKVAQI